MGLLTDSGNGRQWDTFDVQTASTVYWKAVPVLSKMPDREEQKTDLTVRIMTGVNRNNHNSRVLRMQLSNEEDLFFLHSLEVSEEEFQTLKVEQGILVDFANFPGKVVGLLERCIASRAEEIPKFQAVLCSKGGETVLQIVETNDFKQLPHITLAFRQGNDTAVKQFLAHRLTEVLQDCARLATDLRTTQEARDIAERDAAGSKRALAEAEEAAARQAVERDAAVATRDALALQEKTRELAALAAQHNAERTETARKHSAQTEALQSRCTDLEREVRALSEAKHGLDATGSTLSMKLGAAEGSVKALEEETARLRQQVSQLSREKTEAEVEGQELRVKLRALEEKVAAQKEVIQEQAKRVTDLETSVRQQEQRCGELRSAAAGHEARARDAAAEVTKGNQIIETLSGEVRVAKEKLRRKSAIMARQEEEMGARDRQLDALAGEARELQREREHLRGEAAACREENQTLRDRLEESKKVLQSNEQMIRWLNNQVNEAQLKASTAITTSRPPFRPMSLNLGPPTTSAPIPRQTYSTSATPHLPTVGSTQMCSQPPLYKPLSSNPPPTFRHTYGADLATSNPPPTLRQPYGADPASSGLGVTPTLNSSIGQRLTVGFTPGTGGSGVGPVTNVTNASRNAGTEPVAPTAAVKS